MVSNFSNDKAKFVILTMSAVCGNYQKFKKRAKNVTYSKNRVIFSENWVTFLGNKVTY